MWNKETNRPEGWTDCPILNFHLMEYLVEEAKKAGKQELIREIKRNSMTWDCETAKPLSPFISIDLAWWQELLKELSNG